MNSFIFHNAYTQCWPIDISEIDLIIQKSREIWGKQLKKFGFHFEIKKYYFIL